MDKAQINTYAHALTTVNLAPSAADSLLSSTEQKYAEAVEMYATTSLPLRCIAEICAVTPRGLSAYIGRNHRPLLYARYGLDAGDPQAGVLKVRPPQGQSLRTHLKYKEAIEACGDIAYIEYNVSQVARLFDLDGTALASQLRVYYPDVIPSRERLRQRLGIADNTHRGPRQTSVDAYELALELYRNSDLSIPEVAEACQVSKGGLVQFMRFYRKEVIADKAVRRRSAANAVGIPQKGSLSGNGRLYGPSAVTVERYAPAVALFNSTLKSISEIACETGVSASGLRAYLRQWCDARSGLASRRSQKSAEKYAPAIQSLRSEPRPVAQVAAEFGFNPDVFREYLKAHHPDLAASLGRVRVAPDKLIGRSSSEKYRDAVSEYASSAESLKSIARRHGLVYNSLLGYVLRNCPAERESHRKITESATTAAQAEK